MKNHLTEETETNSILSGLNIAITRDERAAAPYKQQVEAMGAKLICIPLVQTKPLVHHKSVHELAKIVQAGSMDYLIFMSTTAAEVFARASAPVNDIAESAKTRMIAVGPMTKARLEALGFGVTQVPFSYSSEGLIALMRNLGVEGKVIGLVRAKGASSYLRENLSSLGAEVIEVGAYEVSEAPEDHAFEDFRNRLLEGGVDVILFTSSFSVKVFAKRLPSHGSQDLNRRLKERVVVVAIGPSTARELESNGVPVSLVSPVHTIGGMFDALAAYMVNKM